MEVLGGRPVGKDCVSPWFALGLRVTKDDEQRTESPFLFVGTFTLFDTYTSVSKTQTKDRQR